MTRRDLLISLLLGLGLAVVLVAGALLLPRGTGEPSAPISDPAPVQQEDRALLGVWAASVGNRDERGVLAGAPLRGRLICLGDFSGVFLSLLIARAAGRV